MSKAAIYTRVNAVTELAGKVYPRKLPQDVQYPAAVYERIGPVNRFSQFKVDADLVEATIQVDVYGEETMGEVAFETLTDKVRVALQRTRGPDADALFIDADRDAYEDDTKLLRRTFDVRVWYRETP